MKCTACIIAIVLYVTSFAQQPFGEQLKSARLQIVKSTVEFLATDSETFKNVRSTSCNDCRTFEEIEAFVKDNQLTGAGNLVSNWKNAPIDSSFAHGLVDLEKFREAVVSKVAGGSRQRRQELPGYDAYIKRLDAIVSGVVANKRTDGAASAASTEPDESTIDLSDTAVKAGSPLAGTVPVAGKSASGLQAYITYGAAGLFALLAFYFFRRNLSLNQKIEELERFRAEYDDEKQTNIEAKRKMNARILDLEDQLIEARKQNDRLQEDYKKERDKKKPVPGNAGTSTTLVPPTSKPETLRPVPPQAKKTAPVIRYARYADQGDGFSISELLEQVDGETIFEITILSPASATFRISDNESAQRYALSNVAYFLSKTCKYDSFPTDNDSIHTDIPGKLELQGNKWAITTPATISFN